jgi:tocopherol cyclase
MTSFHGTSKRRNFFEGWYLKHQQPGHTLALIPAFHIDRQGRKSASLQVISESGAASRDFAAADFRAEQDRFYVALGDNEFCEQGLKVDFQAGSFSVRGELHYAPFIKPQSAIMGPFSRLPLMQCNHDVLSFSHRITGALQVNGEEIDFSGGSGYIEKDWGSSFPRAYLWSQVNWHDAGDCCLMLSVADIPILGANFTGCICAIYYGGQKYRLATYHGVKIRKYTNREVILEQGPYRLELRCLKYNSFALRAPSSGGMTRSVHESLNSKVRYRFYQSGQLVFDLLSEEAGFELGGWG